jgi:hypothetical protein
VGIQHIDGICSTCHRSNTVCNAYGCGSNFDGICPTCETAVCQNPWHWRAVANAIHPVSLVITKDRLHQTIHDMLKDYQASSVPLDGQATMLAYWVKGHLDNGTKVKENE